MFLQRETVGALIACPVSIHGPYTMHVIQLASIVNANVLIFIQRHTVSDWVPKKDSANFEIDDFL